MLERRDLDILEPGFTQPRGYALGLNFQERHLMSNLKDPLPPYPSTQGILIEAEAFDDFGGWVLETQFASEMGSPYLLAHGLGTPVADATTEISIPAGEYEKLSKLTKLRLKHKNETTRG